jgi:hypothetical protein
MSQASVLIRGSVTSVIYSKALSIELKAAEGSSAVTLMSVDVERVCRVSGTVHQLWANPIELALAVWLLERQLGVPCVMPIVLAFGNHSSTSPHL